MCTTYQMQPSRGVLRKRFSENMQQVYRATPMPKCNFNKVAIFKTFVFRAPLDGCFCTCVTVDYLAIQDKTKNGCCIN